MNALQRPYRVSRQTVLLGVVLDLQLEQLDGEQRQFIGEWQGWAMLTQPDAMERAPGRAHIYLAPFESSSTSTRAAGVDAADTYLRWHRREPARVLNLNVPDAFAYCQGRVLRIGYRSDKWTRRGKTRDYDHDFREDGRPAPLLYTDSARLRYARGAVITGGDMRVTEGGID